jgi:hypothetical protein
MRKFLIVPILLLALAPFTGFCQGEKKISSAILNIELSQGSSFETSSKKIKKFNAALENFATTKGYKLAKDKPEVFHTDFDALKTKLIEENYEIVQEENPDFYKITKGDNKYLAYIKQDQALLNSSTKLFPSLQFSILISQYHLIYPFGVTTTITIKRFY